MLHELRITGGFAHRDAVFTFERGLTTITGPNESGKSEILDMIRFAMFGAAALRTPTADYGRVAVVLTFTARGIRYRVERTTSAAKLFREDDLLATGARAVNQRIVTILGYGLAVFDVANVANQNSVAALSSMRAAERKRLIDSTVGLTVLDDLIATCSKDYDALLLTAKAQRSILQTPKEPEPPPVGLDTLPALRTRLAELRELCDQALILRAEATKELPPEPLPPSWPEDIEAETSLESLVALERRRAEVGSQLTTIEATLRDLPEPAYTLEQLKAIEEKLEDWESYQEAKEFLRRHPGPPEWTETAVKEQERLNEEWVRYRAWHRLAKAGEHECPACAHRWRVHADEMAKLGDWEHRQPTRPVLDSAQMITNAYRALAEWRTLEPRWVIYRNILDVVPHEPPKPPITSMLVIQQHRLRHENMTARNNLTAARAELTAVFAPLDPKLPEKVRALRRFHEESAAYTHRRDTRARAIMERDAAALKLAQLPPSLPEKHQEVAAQIAALESYDAAVTRWRAECEQQEKHLRLIEAEEAKAASLLQAIRALRVVKDRIKNHLIPSLMLVGSALLTSFTGGARRTLEIDDDFNLAIDGVPVEGLSGAAKAAANLALRIGLGQVLTNRVFSVFMGDEIDADMDAGRAVSAASTLRGLTDTIAQVILVSHKRPEADHYIEL